MSKIGIGEDGSDANITLKPRGLVTTLVVEQVNSSGAIVTPVGSSSSGGVGKAIASAAQTAQQVSVASIPCQRVVIYNYSANANNIAVGMSNAVIAEDGTKIGTGEQMAGLAVTTIFTTDVSTVWFAAVAKGDGLSYAYYT